MKVRHGHFSSPSAHVYHVLNIYVVHLHVLARTITCQSAVTHLACVLDSKRVGSTLQTDTYAGRENVTQLI